MNPMKFILTGCIFLFSIFLWAQPETRNDKKTIVLLPKEDEKPMEKPIATPKNYTIFEKKEFNFLEEPQKNIDFTGKSKYLTKKTELPKNVTGLEKKSDSNTKIVRQDQYFGEFTTNGNHFNVYCRDHSAIDGDLVNILLNDEVVVNNVMLGYNFQGFNIPLKPGFNKIEIQAINEGEHAPNTAQFKVLDEQGNTLINQEWGLATGFKARFIFIKN